MRPAFRPLRSRFTRLLACVLVVASLLGNGLAFAHVASVKKACCAEMMGKMKHAGGCEDGGKPCPSQNADCDDQCLSRCQSTTVLPVLVLAVPPMLSGQASLPFLSFDDHRLAVGAPELRPPISA
jgi:hypothetical protein